MYQYYENEGDKKHYHELDGKPLIGTSTVVSVIAKPLTWWASGLAVAELGWVKPVDKRKKPTSEEIDKNEKARISNALDMLEKYSGMTPEEYCKLLDKAYKAHAESLGESADKGTNMHEELERYITVSIAANECRPMNLEGDWIEPVKVFAGWARENVKRFIVSEGNCYSERFWVGGITDCIAELNDGRIVIIDFKSSKEAYASQFIQAAGYAIEVEENGVFDKDGNPLWRLPQGKRHFDGYIIFPFGAEKVEPQFQWDTETAKQGFESAVQLYKLINQ